MAGLLGKGLFRKGSEVRYSDLHCHILPGLDDGAADDKAATNMARMAWESGARRLFATPHYMPGVYAPSPETIASSVKSLREKIAAEGLGLEIIEGSEVSLTERLAKDYQEGLIVTLGESDFVLVELPSYSLPTHAADEFFALRLAGAGVILAHPERNSEIRSDPAILREMVDSGLYLQVNAGSLVGEYGKEVQRFARKLVQEGFAHFLGSDAHSGTHRDLLRGGPDVYAAVCEVFPSRAERSRFVGAVEERVDDLLAGRLR